MDQSPDPRPPEASGPEPDPASGTLRRTNRSLPIALLRTREWIMGPIRDMLAASGLSEQKWRILRVLHESGPLELGQLAHHACLLQSSLTRMLRPMQEEGLIDCRTVPEDRRRTIAAITPAGLEVIRRHSAESAAIFAGIEARFGRERLDHLLDLLEELQTLPLSGRGEEK